MKRLEKTGRSARWLLATASVCAAFGLAISHAGAEKAKGGKLV